MHNDEQRRSQIRTKLYVNFLSDIAREQGHEDGLLTRNLTFGRAVASSSSHHTDSNTSKDTSRESQEASGGDLEERHRLCVSLLAEEDIRRFGTPPRPKLDTIELERLREALDSALFSIAEFLHGDTHDRQSLEDRLATARNIPQDIQSLLDSLSSSKLALNDVYDRIQHLLKEVNETHSQLSEQLLHIISTYPPQLASRRSASHDLLATTIETSLIKLSLIRARAHQALYAHTSPSNPKATMAQALAAAHAKLKRDERKLVDEDCALDRQIEDYERLLRLVDGGGEGGFKQVVEDWTSVQRETEECKRDLRRLGWTGD